MSKKQAKKQLEFERAFRKHITPLLNRDNLKYLHLGFYDKSRNESTIVIIDREKQDRETNRALN